MRGAIFLRKMTLGVYVSVKSRIETAVAGEKQQQILRLTTPNLHPKEQKRSLRTPESAWGPFAQDDRPIIYQVFTRYLYVDTA
jgi:hypothetical protein